jgi:hypothetical protein
MKPKPAVPVFCICAFTKYCTFGKRESQGEQEVPKGRLFYAQLRKMWYTFVINRVYLILRRESFLEWYFTFRFPQTAYVYMENFFKWDTIQQKRKMRCMD